VGKEGLIHVENGEPLVDCHEIVQMRRPLAPMAEEEEWGRNGHVVQHGAIAPVLVAAEEAVLETTQSDCDRPGKAGGSDGEMVVAEQFHPIAHRDTAQETGAKVAKRGVAPCHFHSLPSRSYDRITAKRCGCSGRSRAFLGTARSGAAAHSVALFRPVSARCAAPGRAPSAATVASALRGRHF